MGQALVDGVPAGRVKSRMIELEAKKLQLESSVSSAGVATTVRMHPNMAGYYHERIADLRKILAGDNPDPEAMEIVRQLIEKIVLVPAEKDGVRFLSITLEGHIAAILALALNATAPLDQSSAALQVTKLVAGAGSEPSCGPFRL